MERVSRLAAQLIPGMSSGQGSKFKVCVVGAAGGIGQPLALLLKMSPLVSELNLYDVVNTPGVAADLSHINTAAAVKGFVGKEQLGAALHGCDLVVIPAGVPRKPGMTRDDLFNINAGIVKSICEGIAELCPKAFVNIISNPVNSTVPIAAEIFRKAGMYDPRKLFGVTTLDVVRANAFVAEAAGVDPSEMSVPVIGGHAGVTILPLLSQASPSVKLTDEQVDKLTKRIQDAGTEVVQAKAGAGSATLSMAYAAAKFAESCLRAMSGASNIVEYSYVDSKVTDLPFFASKVRIGPSGIEEAYPIGSLSPYERANFDGMLAELTSSIQKGLNFARK
eukprot:jgi/Chlat1/6568/Chrsp45S05936